MKNILLVLFAVILLAACSSAPTQKTIDFENGCSVTLPSDWDVVPGDDTMPNTIMALAPTEGGFRNQMRIDALKPFKMEKGETALKLKESLEGRGSLLDGPALLKISGEPSVAYSWRGKENSAENALLTVDVTHYGYFVCADENIYSLDFSCLTSQADEAKGVFDEAVYSFQTAGSKARAREAELARIKAEKEAEAERQAALEAEKKAQAEEAAFAAAEDEAAAIEAEAAAEKEAVEEEVIEEEAIPFQLVEEKPSFMGGDANAFSKWVNERLQYPEIAKENGIQGRVLLQFVVGADGKVSNVKVVRGVDPALDKEAVRVVQSSPKWSPGKQRDRAVKVTYTFPVIFQLR